jgi:HK97 family phage major capsid protein
MNVKELLEKRGNIWEHAKALIDTAEAEGRDFSAEEQAQYDKMMGEMDELAKRAKRLEEKQRLEAQMEMPANEPVRVDPAADGEAKRQADLMPEFRAFIKSGVIGPHLRDLQVTGTDPGDVGAMGGYMVPPEQFIADLIKELDNKVFVRGLATVIPVTTSDSLGVPTLEEDVEDPDWTAEVGEVDADTAMVFGKRALTPHQLTKLVKVSMKLLRTSAIPVEGLVRERLSFKFAAAQENNFLNGDGDGKPLGVLVADPNGISDARDVSDGNSETAIGADNLFEVKYALKEQYRGGAQWIFHREAVKQIAKLKDGEGQYLWRPGLAAGQPDTLLNLPVNESEYAPSTFTSGDYVGILGNFRYYWIAELFGMEIQRLNELFAKTNQIGFIGRMWTDGAPVLESAFARVTLA